MVGVTQQRAANMVMLLLLILQGGVVKQKLLWGCGMTATEGCDWPSVNVQHIDQPSLSKNVSFFNCLVCHSDHCLRLKHFVFWTWHKCSVLHRKSGVISDAV